MGKWLERIQSHTATKTATQGTCKTVRRAFGGFAGSLDRRIQDKMALSEAIALASDWMDLSAICDRIDMACIVGELPDDEADQLIAAVEARSREVPETAGDRSGLDTKS